MDGNRRWAKNRGLMPFEGHKAGVDALRNLVKIAPSYGIQYLTAYTFSTENWKRAEHEKEFLFKLLKDVSLKELSKLHEANVKVKFIGDIKAFSKDLYDAFFQLEEKTKENSGLNLQIALNYGAIDEINNAIKQIKEKLNTGDISKEDIQKMTDDDFSQYLYTQGIPDPELVLRTGGEHRLSNYLLWQAADARLAFLDTLWPDFSEDDLIKVLN